VVRVLNCYLDECSESIAILLLDRWAESFTANWTGGQKSIATLLLDEVGRVLYY